MGLLCKSSPVAKQKTGTKTVFFISPLLCGFNAAADNARIPQTAQVQCRRGYANRFRDLGI